MTRRVSCPEGFCLVPECGKPLRPDTWCEFCDGHFQIIPLDIKRLLMRFGKSSVTSAAPDRKKRQPLEYHAALKAALDAIAEKAKGFTGSMSRTITDRDLSNK